MKDCQKDWWNFYPHDYDDWNDKLGIIQIEKETHFIFSYLVNGCVFEAVPTFITQL